MGLASALSTSLTGMTAAETQIDIIGNNLANSQTVGFKASNVVFATQFLQTLSLGSAPTTDTGGTDPRQTGLGVQVAAISPNFNQGTVQGTSSPSDLAIQGEGMFIVEGASSERLYTRTGILNLNSANELVTPTGQRLLGYGIDDQYRIEATDLVPLTIPLGSQAVAQPTTEVVMEGTLTPNGDIADTAEVIQSAVLGNAAVPRPNGSDITLTTVAGPSPDGDVLNGNYSYMVTYYSAGNPETRPSVILGPHNIVSGRIELSDLPAPPAPPPEGGFPAYDSIRIYRNISSDQNSFFLVDTIPVGDTYLDSKSDAAISDLSIAGNKQVDLNGPSIDSNTLLTNVTRLNGFDYVQPFPMGTLSFEARKGGRVLPAKEFEITATSTVQDLVHFMEEALGIQTLSLDSTQPIPQSVNNIPGETGTLAAGGYIRDGQIRFVSNNGVDNALEIDLTNFRMTTPTGEVSLPNLAFGSIQEAQGQSAVADFITYDSLGMPIRTRVTAVLESRTDTATTYRWFAESSDNLPLTGASTAIGNGTITFDGRGNFSSASHTTVTIDRSNIPSVSPLQFNLDFTGVSGLATQTATLAASRQDGSPPGTLTSYVIGEDGIIRGVFSNGITRNLGEVRLARFANPEGLVQRGQNLYAQGINTGLPIYGRPGENGIGKVTAGALELSNTDIGGDLVKLVLASTQYRSNARVITSTQQLFDELLNIRR